MKFFHLQYTKSEEHLTSNWQVRERAYSNDWDKERQNERQNSVEEVTAHHRPVSRRDFERKSENYGNRSRSRNGMLRSSGPMETLDRRISASTDNLDTLKRERRNNKLWHENKKDHRPRYVLPYNYCIRFNTTRGFYYVVGNRSS